MRKGPVPDTTIDRIARPFKTRRISLLQDVDQPPPLSPTSRDPNEIKPQLARRVITRDSPDINHDRLKT